MEQRKNKKIDNDKLRNAQVQHIFKIARDSPIDTARNFENILNLCISLGEAPYNLIHDDL